MSQLVGEQPESNQHLIVGPEEARALQKYLPWFIERWRAHRGRVGFAGGLVRLRRPVVGGQPVGLVARVVAIDKRFPGTAKVS